MGTWILIMALHGSSVSAQDFATVTTQEFSSQAACEDARSTFEKRFASIRVYTAKAVCVSKG